MVGPTAQLVALCCHFNGRARGVFDGPFFPDNSTCRFCEYIHFLRFQSAWFGAFNWSTVVATTDEWLAREALAGRFAFLLHAPVGDHGLSDRMTAGLIGGGGKWQLAVVSDKRPNLWESSWDVGNRDAADQRIWRVNYKSIAEVDQILLPTARTLDSVRLDLHKALTDIVAFADDHGIDGFGDCFRKAIKCLSSDDPFAEVYHRDLAPHGVLDLSGKQILAACQAAWVFGGMGSWNDMGFDGEEQSRYDRVSEKLYSLLNEGICASANSSVGKRA
jgi:hypothetical protein